MKEEQSHLGTHRTRNRARKLRVQQRTDGTWLVTGGEAEHTVVTNGTTYTCDCGKQERSTDRMCSHVLAVWLAVNGNFKR